MAYTIQFEKAAIRALKKLPSDVSDKLRPVIESLGKEPRPAGCLKLKGGSDLWRIRSGDYRIIYQIQGTRLIVLIVDVGHRRDIYN